MELILKLSNTKTIDEQFKNGIKLRPDRLNGIKEIIVIQHDEIIDYRYLNNNEIVYNAETKAIRLNSLLGDRINNGIIGKKVNYNTFNPATLNDLNAILK